MIPSLGPIDHPLIVIAQAVCAVGLFRYFLLVHKEQQPVPQMILALAVSLLINLACRVMGSGWFWVADIAQYTLWAVLIVTSVIAKRKRIPVEALPDGQFNELSTEPEPVSGIGHFFDSNRNKLTWGISVLVLALVGFHYIKTYTEERKAEQSANRRVTEANTKAMQQYTKEQQKQEKAREQVVSTVSSLTARQDTLLSKLDSLGKAQKQLQEQETKAEAKRRTDARKITNKVDTANTNTKTILKNLNAKPDEQPEQKPKKSWFDRIFGRTPADIDSTYHARSNRAIGDTLVLH